MQRNNDISQSAIRAALRIAGILVVGGVAIIALFPHLSAAAFSEETDVNEDAVVAQINAASANCTPEFPLEIILTNVSDKDVLNVGFSVSVSDRVRSTPYYTISGSGMSTDVIIPPDHTYRDCYRMPRFHVGENYPIPADGIPDSLASPQYEVIVTGARLREAE